MTYWIFMMWAALLIPVILILSGKYLMKRPPKEVNRLFGFRTKRSMKNEDTWKFGNMYCGKMWWNFGWIMLLATAAVMFFVRGGGTDRVSMFAICVMTWQLLILTVAVALTERKLKKAFDEKGRWR